MPRGKRKPPRVGASPEIEVGDWRGEFAGSPSGNIGQHIQPWPPITVVESTYLLVGGVVVSPISKFRWPAVVSFLGTYTSDTRQKRSWPHVQVP